MEYFVFISVLMFSVLRVNGQISTPCSSSMISSFTPCFNYLTGSSGSGSPPTEDCCNSLKTLITDNMDCTCLIVTGNVPVSIPFVNRTLAISLPRMCKNSVPLRCKASGVALPAPGPALFAPTEAPTTASAPHHAHSPRASKAPAAEAPPSAETPVDIAVASPPKVASAPTANPGVRPVLTPNSGSKNPSVFSLASLVLMLAGIMVQKFI